MPAPQSSPGKSGGSPAGAAARGPLVAGLDVGTTSVKAVLVDERGTVIGRRRLPSRLTVGPGGRFEHDAVATWWEGPRLALAGLLWSRPARAPRAVAVSAMMPSVSAVDLAGQPLGPGLLYGDGRRARPDESEGSAPRQGDPTASDEMARLAGWAAINQPEASGYWPAQAVANASLGGEGVIDFASAMATGRLFNGSGWDEEACAHAGLRLPQLPRVAMFGERIGELRPGLWPGGDPGEGTVLGAGSVDGLCELLVTGAVQEGDVLVALGSTLVVWLCVPGWPECPPGLWRVPHLVAGKAMVGGASNAGGMWADWVDRLLRPGEAERPRPGDVPLWWPWARGERVPWHDPDLRITMRGADLSHGPAALRHAAFEASAFVARHIVNRAAATGTEPRRYLVSGGGTANRDWLQALADVMGAPVLPAAVPEGAALGAAFLARLAAGLESSPDDAARWARFSAAVEPRADWAEATAARYQQWSEALPDRPIGRPPASETARPGTGWSPG